MYRPRVVVIVLGVLLTSCGVAWAQGPQDVHDAATRYLPNVMRTRVDDRAAAAAGIRKLASKRLTLYTDLPSSAEVDILPHVFDLAFPQYCAYFGVDAAKLADWHVTGFLMKDKARFQRTGLLPPELPPFPNGYARNYEFWLYEQPSDYYRRHLVLHEGVHCFMLTVLGATGPPWYTEGMAELLGTHQWKDGRLKLGRMPADKEETPYWGRVKFIKDALAERRLMSLRDVVGMPADAHRHSEAYAWCWAACALLDRHPRYQQRFRQLSKDVLRGDFNERFYRAIGDDWDDLADEWQLFAAGLEYGHDVPRSAVVFGPGEPLPAEGTIKTVAADRGWQSSGVQLQQGVAYRIRAAGRYQVADQPQIWWCEPGGVSIRYYRGRPLGMLLAAVRPEGGSQGTSALLRPIPVGLGTRITPRTTGTLYLKINDSPAELADNAGDLKVKIERE